MPVYPCFSILADDCRGPYLVQTGSGQIAMPVLTDNDLLDRFQKKSGTVGPTITFGSAAQLLLYLDALPKNVTHVAFDPSERDKATTVSLTEFYKKVLDSLNRE